MNHPIEEIFNNKFFLTFKDKQIHQSYISSRYQFLKIYLSLVFIFCLTLQNIIFEIKNINPKMTEAENTIERRMNYILIAIQILSFLIMTISLFIKKLKQFLNNSFYHFISFQCLFNIFLQFQIMRSITVDISNSYLKEYLIPYCNSTLGIFYIFFIDKNFISGSLSFFLANVVFMSCSIGQVWYNDWVSMLCQGLQWIGLSGFNYFIDKSDKEMFVLYDNTKSNLDIKRDFIEHLNCGILILSEDLVDFNSKTKTILELDDNEEINMLKIQKFILQNYVEINENLDENVKQVILNCSIGEHIDTNFKIFIEESLKFMKENTSFQEFVYIGNKTYRKSQPTTDKTNNNDFTLRVYMRYNKFSKLIEIFLIDISSIVEVEDLKASDKYRKLFINKFSHEFKNPLINILQLIRNLKTKMNEKQKNASNNSIAKIIQMKTVKLKQSNTYTTEFSGETFNNENANYTCNVIDLRNLSHVKYLSEYMISLIGDFDFISNIDFKTLQNNDKKIIEEGKFNLEKLIKNCIRIFQTKAEITEKQTKFIYEIDKEVKIMNSDARRIKQIILNILSNSFKFTQNGEISIQIFKEIENNNLISCIIRDTGTGIKNPDIINDINKDNNNLYKNINAGNNNIYGMGLSLRVVKILVSLLGKNFEIQSKENNKGTKIKFSLYLDLSKRKEIDKKESLFSLDNTNEQFIKSRNDSSFHFALPIEKLVSNLKKTLTYSSNNFKYQPNDPKKKIKNVLPRSQTDNRRYVCSGFKKIPEMDNFSFKPQISITDSKKDLTGKFIISEENSEKLQEETETNKDTCSTLILQNYNLNIGEQYKSFSNIEKNFENNLNSDLMISTHKLDVHEYVGNKSYKCQSSKNVEFSNRTTSMQQIMTSSERTVIDIKNEDSSLASFSNCDKEELMTPLRIIIVDDEKLIRQSEMRMIVKFFKKENKQIDIFECSDGVECLYLVYKGIQNGIQYDFIITDETMNFMRGSLMAATLRTLMSDNSMYKIKMFMVTSYEYSSIIENFGNVVDGIITKPLSQDNIMQIFSNYE